MTCVNGWTDVEEWAGKSSQLLIKKLSRNDCSWADDRENGHQNGVYIPHDIRESGLFPPLQNINAKKPHIFESLLPTLWPATGETKKSKLKHYSNKGPEMHLTGVPRDEFSGLTPASLLIGGVLHEPINDICHWFMTLDSASLEAELLESLFDLGADFHYGLFDPADAFKVQKDETEQLIDDLAAALKSGSLDAFIANVSKMPAPETLAADAQRAYIEQNDLLSLDPYSILNPGDAIMKISRDIEYTLYKRAEKRHRAAEVIRIVTEGGTDLVASIVRSFPALDAMFLSASQQRKSRAGRSFEQHIARLLRDGRILFEEQVVTGGRRPDFVLPSLVVLTSVKRTFEEAIVLSAKTTLRERWKQVTLEKLNCALFLATVDDRVSPDAIDGMKTQGIHLVVPESLKESKETCYGKKSNVISFREFFDEEISARRSAFRPKASGYS